MVRRKFLFLQGVATPFFKRLSTAIRKKGHETYRVSFCGGDKLFSLGTENWRFKQPLDKLPTWLEEKHKIHRFTDVILFGDTRPVHTSAIQFLKSKGVRIHVFEEGYLRPNWITLESDGVNGNSQLIDQPTEFWNNDQGNNECDTTQAMSKTFGVRAIHDINYRLANACLKPFFPHYQTHRPTNAFFEYCGWIKRLPSIKLWHESRDNKAINQLVVNKQTFYLFPLQLDSDSQIKVHSPYRNIEHAIQTVMESFAQNSPDHSVLVIKNHPLATGLVDHQQQINECAEKLDIKSRILFLESGNLPALLKNTAGTVLVNSTTGTSALYHGSPTCALGKAIFDMPGLTFQHGLDRFWKEGQPADQALFRNFRNTVIRHTQINGDFYSRKGTALAIEGCLQRMNIKTVTTPTYTPHRDVMPQNLIPVPTYGGKLPENSYQYKKH